MPFDATALQNILDRSRQPDVTVLPPTPPERGEGPRRVRIEIEIVQRRGADKFISTSRLGAFTVTLFLILVLASLAHGQPRDPQNPTYEHFQGRNWHGETFHQGTVEDTRLYGPDGRQRHCHSYVPGGAQGNPYDRITTCD